MYSPGDSGQPMSQAMHPWTGVAEREPLAPVLLLVAPPARQSRLTVFFRLLLAIPHYIALAVFGIAVEVVLIISWVGALILGRLPDFAAEFLGGYLRWSTNVQAYTSLLTDVYPPFTLEDTDYPVRLAFRPGRLNRFAVLFRSILSIPAGIISYIVAIGSYLIVGFVAWVIVLVIGRLPAPLHGAWAAGLRYQARLNGYLYMLTSAYPAGLYGDRPTADTMPGNATADYPMPGGAAPGYAAPEYGPPGHPTPGYGTPGYAAPGYAAPGYGTPGYAAPGYAMPGQTAPGAGSPWGLVLSSGARKLLTFFLVLGTLSVGGYVTIGVIAVKSVVSNVEALDQVQNDSRPFFAELNDYPTKVQNCGKRISCVSALNSATSAAFASYASQISAISMPHGAASSDAADLVNTATKLSATFYQLSKATTRAQLKQITSPAAIDSELNTINQEFDDLQLALGARRS